MIFDRLTRRIQETQNPAVVGLDPRPEYIPAFIMEKARQSLPDILAAVSAAILEFNKALVDALCDIVPAVKPQIAFYEQYGAAGVDCYRETIRYAKSKNFIVIGDIKRGDIAAVAGAYANAHLGRVTVGGQENIVFDTDIVTVNPYMGYDVIQPFLENAQKYDKGIFALVKTSNPSSKDIQDIETPAGKVYELVADRINEWNGSATGEYGYGRIGAVVGATHPAQAEELRKRMPHVFFLVPGYGAQGGTAADVNGCFNPGGLGAVINNSRGIIAAHTLPAYKEKYAEKDFALAAREAALQMRSELGFILQKPQKFA
jgi:orotidine-5'-phosphate decarboxylase